MKHKHVYFLRVWWRPGGGYLRWHFRSLQETPGYSAAGKSPLLSSILICSPLSLSPLVSFVLSPILVTSHVSLFPLFFSFINSSSCFLTFPLNLPLILSPLSSSPLLYPCVLSYLLSCLLSLSHTLFSPCFLSSIVVFSHFHFCYPTLVSLFSSPKSTFPHLYPWLLSSSFLSPCLVSSLTLSCYLSSGEQAERGPGRAHWEWRSGELLFGCWSVNVCSPSMASLSCCLRLWLSHVFVDTLLMLALKHVFVCSGGSFLYSWLYNYVMTPPRGGIWKCRVTVKRLVMV